VGAELRTRASLPDWTAAFLTARCAALQADLDGAGPVVRPPDEEADMLHCWGLLLLAAAENGDPVHGLLEELLWLQARIEGRLDRGGVADIAPDVDRLVRTILADRLQGLTARAVAVLDKD
jgi:hypothetical protein